ncbi:MAG: phosphatidate cytidylyltransferase [Spirochaetes bacterium]|uniref:Phosphatidate cytidylyltransferase n=1 Tax=Candidatus Gallitreponema excrementavium TaxID=2840840 RepID=A0A9D9HRD0_9SPIR|nr:phosphatidate cytidylyltransferase [Candidatus Gallitreponema excrementavium]
MRRDLFKELFRKSIHFCSAFIPLIDSWNHTFVLWALTGAVVMFCIEEFLRLNGHPVPLVSKITETAARKRDQGRFVLGPVTLCLGILTVLLVFPPMEAYLGIYALGLGDGIASLAGRFLGKNSIPYAGGKTIEGSAACFLIVFIAFSLVTRDLVSSAVLALFTTIMEAFPLKDFDNLLIPVAVAVAARSFGF